MRISKWKTLESGRGTELLCDAGKIFLYGVTEDIIRCVYTKHDTVLDTSPLEIRRPETQKLQLREDPEKSALEVSTNRLKLMIDLTSGQFTWYRKEAGQNGDRLLLREGEKELTEKRTKQWSTFGEPPVIRRVHTVDGDRNFIDNLRAADGETACQAKLRFLWQTDEAVHGLGQGEDGIYDYRGHVQYLYQHNMRIPMPWILSDQGYAVLADCGSLMTFCENEKESYLQLDAVEQLDYYFVSGDDIAGLIRGYRHLTGKAAMLPKWAFGYVQSRERYKTQEELVETAREYRRRGVGLDCIVQDWKTWQGDRWGEKKLDAARFPDRSQMRRDLHDIHVHSMVSVWPNMNYDTVDCQEMQEKGFLLNDLSTYNAFNPDARALYWKQAEEGLYRDGFDSWWCDSTEPFSGPDWGGEEKRSESERFALVGEEHKKYLGETRANLYALHHARGIYENEIRSDGAHRVLNLTRSGYPGIQKYGAVLWSGDVTATWETFRKQITESLNIALSGHPYWTFDAGAFFVVNRNWRGRGCGCDTDPSPKWFWRGDFEEGVRDPGYKELYVRWLQAAAFLPMMRSHGTDTPREIWQFGEEGTPYYDAIKEAISVRYRLMPYLYSLAGSVYLDDALMQRPLLMEFPEDKKAARSSDGFMLGKSLLVYPVTKPMDFGPGGSRLEGDHAWKCYLPSGSDWVRFADMSGQVYSGGQEITIDAELGTIPCFVRAGSILPMEEGLQYADEVRETPLEIRIIPGSDAEFLYYEDEGDGLAYREGVYNRISMSWCEKEKRFTIGSADHAFTGGLVNRRCLVMCGSFRKEFVYTGSRMSFEIG